MLFSPNTVTHQFNVGLSHCYKSHFDNIFLLFCPICPLGKRVRQCQKMSCLCSPQYNIAIPLKWGNILVYFDQNQSPVPILVTKSWYNMVVSVSNSTSRRLLAAVNTIRVWLTKKIDLNQERQTNIHLRKVFQNCQSTAMYNAYCVLNHNISLQTVVCFIHKCTTKLIVRVRHWRGSHFNNHF